METLGLLPDMEGNQVKYLTETRVFWCFLGFVAFQ
jgi:hypothetical protein